MHPEATWKFPLPRTHTGVLQGNGAMGVMIWGEKNVLRVTVNRSDFWDHRGGMPWVEGMSYAHIRKLLADGDEEGLRALFERDTPVQGRPQRPSLLPLGRIEIVLAPEMRLTAAHLDMHTGQVAIEVEVSEATHDIILDLSMREPLLHIAFPESLPMPAVRQVTAWEFVGDYLRSISFVEPTAFHGEKLSGWVQPRPADPPLCLGYRIHNHAMWLALDYGEDVVSAQATLAALLDRAISKGVRAFREANTAWWTRYWDTVPHLEIPNDRLSFLYHYGLYKFAGLTNPDSGIAAGLQGPWIEEYQMPPWSGDYHFNINVQMCYWPAYRANLLPHLKPLFDMISSWTTQLRSNAQVFVGIDDGLMLPHAVDDRCTCMGGFWTGSVDHGCTAWVAEMMHRYFQYSGDVTFLRDTAFPFMVGAMRVYEEMLERNDDNWVLPVSVSPEYRGHALNAWGSNASFQLACIHYLCESLLEACAVLGLDPKPLWCEIQNGLPRAALWGPDGLEQIALWDGTLLEQSHRHHSHLAGIFPFDTLDLEDPRWARILECTLENWIVKGMGMWSGWCVPWAAAIHTRFSNADMALLLLEIWDRVFTNEGHGTLHDCVFPGFTGIGAPSMITQTLPMERMQMDAGMGVTAAIMEMLLHTRRGVNYLFAGAPSSWHTVGFSGILTEGAHLVGATRVNGFVTEVTVKSKAGGRLRLANPWSGAVLAVYVPGTNTTMSGAILELSLDRHQSVTLTAQSEPVLGRAESLPS